MNIVLNTANGENIALSQRIHFTNATSLDPFVLNGVSINHIINNQLVLNDLENDLSYSNIGLLSKQYYSGDLDVILSYKNHALLNDGYQGVINLLLAPENYQWNNNSNPIKMQHKLYKTLDYSWFTVVDTNNSYWGTTQAGRLQNGYLRITRHNHSIKAYYYYGKQWKPLFNATHAGINEVRPLRVGIKLDANYNDTYSAQFDFLHITNDTDGDGLSNAEELALGLNPNLSDSDNDGLSDSQDSEPKTTSSTTCSTRIHNTLSISCLITIKHQLWVTVQNTTDQVLTTTVPLANKNNKINGFKVNQIQPFEKRLYTLPNTVNNDIDDDQISNKKDNCPWLANPNQSNVDADSQGDLCDNDIDGDGLPNHWETQYGLNPLINDASHDLDGDGVSNLNEYLEKTLPNDPSSHTDGDHDGLSALNDNCPTIANPDQQDTDGDHKGNACDLDNDNDGMLDTWEIANGLNPLDPSDYSLDSDGDGFLNIDEYQFGNNPLDYSCTPLPVYPSTLTAWVIPGNQKAPQDQASINQVGNTIMDVINWETHHADIAFGADYQTKNTQFKAVIGYNYHQKLDFIPTQLEIYLRNKAEEKKIDYEDFFLHFNNDTILNIANTGHASKTPLYGRLELTGYTNNNTDVGRTIELPSEQGQAVFSHSANGGAFYTVLFEKFDQLNITLAQASSGGSLTLEYPSAMDDNNVVTQWSPLTLIEDNSQQLTQNGSLRWLPPSNWKRVSIYNTKEKNGIHLGSEKLAQGNRYYIVRLKLNNATAPYPLLQDISLRRWIKNLQIDKKRQMIPGWNSINDSNHDGYIDDQEFAQRSDTQASARFRYESRVTPIGRMWSERSSHHRTNLANTQLLHYLSDYYAQLWASKQLTGSYNDDLFRLLGSNVFDVVNGGHITELSNDITDIATQEDYEYDLANFLKHIRTRTATNWSSANISAVNLYTTYSHTKFIDSLDAVLREDYLITSTGLSGFFGLNKTWDTFALAKSNTKSIIMAMNKEGRASRIANTQYHWQKDSESGLAQYYLLNLPGRTYFQAWNSTYYYGSDNTVNASSSYWKAGVPKNIAYQPTAMLAIDIGIPSGIIPTAKEAMKYMTKTHYPKSDYTVIGDSTDDVLSHPELPFQGKIAVIPSHIYYLTRSTNEVVLDGPSEMVLARDYTNGLVLYRTNFFGRDLAFMNSTSTAIPLNEPYQRILSNGQLGPIINHITLKGYEGAILVKANQ